MKLWRSCCPCSAPGGQCVLRRGVMRAPCSLYCLLWFSLLLGAGSLLLLSRLQDLPDVVPQQLPGSRTLVAPQWHVEKTEPWFHVTSSPSPPPQFDPAPSAKPPVSKRHRKLLLKNPFPAYHLGDRLLSDALEARIRILRDVCSLYQPDVSRWRISLRQVARVYVEDRHHLLYCEVPKSGCSNWKRVLMVLSGNAHSTTAIPHEEVHYSNKLHRLEAYSQNGIGKRLHAFRKVIFVREPFERLVSAFRDKFENPNSYYHPVFGRPIIAKYRPNATWEALQTGAGVTFREFIQYLLDVRRPVGMDIHWEPVSQMCSPCLMRYSFIGKFENLESEANFLLRNIGAPTNLTFPHFKDRNPNAERTSAKITREYFYQLNATERQKVYDFYYMDYLMFDYPKPFEDLY